MFRQEFKDALEATEVNLDGLEPSDNFDMPATPSNSVSNVVPTEVVIAVDYESRIGMKEDIAEERVRDGALPSSYLPAIMHKMGNCNEGSRSRK